MFSAGCRLKLRCFGHSRPGKVLAWQSVLPRSRQAGADLVHYLFQLGILLMKLTIHPLVQILILLSCLPVGVLASSRRDRRAAPAPAFMDVRLDAPVRFSHLKPGNTLEGKVTQDVFSGYRLMVPHGSQIRLTVSGTKRGPRKHNNLWPWPVRYLRPKYKKLPLFDFADVSLPDGRKMHLPVSDVSVMDPVHVTPQAKPRIKSGEKSKSASGKTKRAKAGRHLSGSTLELVVDAGHSVPAGILPESAAKSAFDQERFPGIKTLRAGTEAKLALLDALSASKSRAGDPFRALLIKPIRLDSGGMLPEGTVFEGHVTKSVPPRWLSRQGALYITFTRMTLPTDARLPIAASLAGVDVGPRSHTKMSSEGGLRGGSWGKAHLLINLGIGAGISKVTDDSYQLIAEALISTATDASTAGSARLIGAAFTGLYLLTRHGRDVTLPPYTRVTIRFDRPPFLPSSESNGQRASVQ